MTLTSASLGNKQSLEFFAKKKEKQKTICASKNLAFTSVVHTYIDLNTHDEWWFTLLWLSLAGVREDQWLGSSYSENAA